VRRTISERGLFWGGKVHQSSTMGKGKAARGHECGGGEKKKGDLDLGGKELPLVQKRDDVGEKKTPGVWGKRAVLR